MLKHLNLVVILAVAVPIISGGDQVILNPTDDAFVWQPLPDINYGNLELLVIGRQTGDYITLIKFDLTPYSGTTVNSAYLRLYVYGSDGVFPPVGDIYNNRNATDWDEDTVTWTNRPGVAEYTIISTPSTYDWWVIDVTSWVQGFVGGTYPNYGFQIYLVYYYEGTRFYMRSKEYATDRPELEVNYTTAVESASLGEIKAAFK